MIFKINIFNFFEYIIFYNEYNHVIYFTNLKYKYFEHIIINIFSKKI